MSSLPIEPAIKELQSSLLRFSQVVLQAPPGAGKSTFLPLTMIKENWFSGKILLLEPRRLAAKNIACHLSALLNEPVGGKVGYRMRGESKISKNTRLEIVTEGVLTRILQQDPELTGIDLIIFDEFHERNLHADLGLAFALDVQAGLREDLKLLIMSATLDNSELTAALPKAKFITLEGRSFPIDYIYQSRTTSQRVTDGVVALVKRAYLEKTGNILVFVAGIKEIKQCESLLKDYFSGNNDKVLIASLYGALSLNEQQKAIQNCATGQRKIVIATNIAETSLTIEGITVVVDSGFERCLSFQAQSGVGKLQTQSISEANATQRAGRAGRLSHGTCYRLWSQEKRLAKQAKPEIERTDLTALVLEMLNWGVSDPQALTFITQPPKRQIHTAMELLKTMRAVDAQGRCSNHGQAILQLGVSPRLGHLILTAQLWQEEHQIEHLLELACLLVALLESNERGADDLEICLNKPSPKTLQHQQLLLKKMAIKRSGGILPVQHCGLLLAVAFPDRIAKVRDMNAGKYLLSNGIGASLPHGSSLLGKNMLVVADLALSDLTSNSLIYKACAVSVEMLQSFLPEYFSRREYLCWQLQSKKLVAEKRLYLGKLLINKQPLTAISNEQKQQAVLTGLQQAGLSVLTWSDENTQLLVRLQYAFTQLKAHKVELDFPDFSETALLQELSSWLAPYLNGVSKPEQLKRLDIKGALLSRLSWDVQQQFNKLFPTHITVPSGSNIKLLYRENEIPVLSVRMQELFGQAHTPRIFNDLIKVQLALLSPAMRPLQLTQDLNTFWQGAYVQVKKEMRGRYPKHYWPDNPLEAVATKRTKKQIKIK
ncbi:ATP-dependent helicase HrpB [Psychromonas sp.]|uniref:ATP-dependent helicase HrpB n=1 Tax=Psychromonas sp. TaxID=1884585 RepID=UPI00356580B6